MSFQWYAKWEIRILFGAVIIVFQEITGPSCCVNPNSRYSLIARIAYMTAHGRTTVLSRGAALLSGDDSPPARPDSVCSRVRAVRLLMEFCSTTCPWESNENLLRNSLPTSHCPHMQGQEITPNEGGHFTPSVAHWKERDRQIYTGRQIDRLKSECFV